MWKDCEIVMLPSKRSRISLYNDVLADKRNSPYDYMEDCVIKPQNLYVISDEEITISDWYYTKGLNMIFQATAFPLSCKDAKKIIATTDSSLKVDISKTLGVSRSLPSPSQKFIEQWIKWYNGKTIPVKIKVEYEEEPTDDGNSSKYSSLFINSDNTININYTERVWTLDDVFCIAYQAYEKGIQRAIVSTTESFHDWIKTIL